MHYFSVDFVESFYGIKETMPNPKLLKGCVRLLKGDCDRLLKGYDRLLKGCDRLSKGCC